MKKKKPVARRLTKYEERVRGMNYRKRGDEILRLSRLLKSANAKVRYESARWDEKCPKGHLIRYDECDLVGCYLVTIGTDEYPYIALAPKAIAPITQHEWIKDALSDPSVTVSTHPEPPAPDYTPRALLSTLEFQQPLSQFTDWSKFATKLYDQFPIVERKVGWWWRVPYGWWLKLWRKK
jgi:hypothetical protein